VTVLFALQGDARLEGNRLIVESAHVDWFTDRPERHAGRVTNEDFVKGGTTPDSTTWHRTRS
jgi:hypothetical protein